MLDSAIRWDGWRELQAFSVRSVATQMSIALVATDNVLQRWLTYLTERQKADWPAVATRQEFDAITASDSGGWSPQTAVRLVRQVAVPDFGVLDEMFRDRALFDQPAALVHFCPLVWNVGEFREALSNLEVLEKASGFGEAHALRLRALIARPITNLIACSFLTPAVEGEADGLVYQKESAFPEFPNDAFCQSLRPAELRQKSSFWFSPSSLGHSESVMSRLAKVEAKLEELGRGRYLAGNLRRAFGVRQLGEAEAATKVRRIAESIAVRVLRQETGKRVTKPFADVVEALTQMPRTRIPARVITHLEGARRIGNRGAHADEFERPDVDARDVEVALLQVLNLVEWYLFDYDPAK